MGEEHQVIVTNTSSVTQSTPEEARSTYKQYDVREDYSIGKDIGKGSFSTVNECTNKSTGERFALKSIEKSKIVECRQIENEIKILKRSSHPNIIQLIEVYETQDFLYIVMELISGGELYGQVLETGPFNEQKVHHLFNQLVEAVKYLHSIHITHRDLKLENILVSDNLQLKLSDFGLSKMFTLSDIEMMKTRVGTPCYVAPEILMGESYTNTVDLWSLGVILYLMSYCQYPFIACNIYQMYELITSGKIEFPEQTESSVDLQDLIRGLLKVDIKERFTLEDIINHPWIAKHSTSTFSQNNLSLSSTITCFSPLRASASGESQSILQVS